MDNVVIRRAGPADRDQAWRILNEYYDAVDVMVRDDREAFLLYDFWLAERDGAVVGCIALRPLHNVPQAGEIKRLYVQPSSRSLGIAAALLDAVHRYAVATGYAWLYLDSRDDLKAALRFYEKHGYEPCARYNDNPQATIFMRRFLAA